jgi:hypothetical protein
MEIRHLCGNLRGGGEYGSLAYGRCSAAKAKNVFDDLIAAAEYLQQQQYTAAEPAIWVVAQTVVYWSGGRHNDQNCLRALPAVGIRYVALSHLCRWRRLGIRLQDCIIC